MKDLVAGVEYIRGEAREGCARNKFSIALSSASNGVVCIIKIFDKIKYSIILYSYNVYSQVVVLL
ncbi:hypothetical protein Hanom_Chr07g00652241 [Helianthus anomalus]